MYNRKLGRGIMALSVAAALAATACGGEGTAASQGAEGETTTLRLGHIAPEGTAYDILANEFKDRVEAASDGRLEIQIYPAGQLGVDRELMEGMQLGNVDATVITASDINQFVPDMAVQDLPYLFEDWEHVWAFVNSDAAQELYALTDAAQMKTLGFMPRGFRHITNNKGPINSPDDLKGLKLRVAESEVYLDTFSALGANAQAMAWGEVFTALQQGTIDGHENTIITIRDYKIDEVQDYLSLTGHFFAFGALQMSSSTFDELSAEDQELIKTAATEAVIAAGEIQEQAEADVLQELKDKGLQVNEVSDKNAFVELVQPVIEKYGQDHDLKYFEAIQDLAGN